MVRKGKKEKFMSFNSKDFKGFTFRSGPVKKIKQSFSTFWDNSFDDTDVDSFLGLDTEYLNKLEELVLFYWEYKDDNSEIEMAEA